MIEAFFYGIDPWLVGLILAVLFMAVVEFGYQLARRYGSQPEGAQFEPYQGAVFGLLALLLAFTFAAASSRYDARRLQVVNEANAMGTAYLRAQTLPEPYKTQATRLIREYVDVQISYFSLRSTEELGEPVARTNQLQEQLWSVTQAAATANPDPVVSLFEASINDVIDMQTRRLAVFLNRVPAAIWSVLSLIAMVVFFVIGYLSGLRGHRGVMATVMLSVLVALVIVMIIDLDRYFVGPTRVSPQPLLDLRESIRP